MNKREQVVSELEKEKAMYIFRAASMQTQDLIDAVQAVKNGGGRLIEITYGHRPQEREKSLAALRLLKHRFGELRIGTGTILNAQEAMEALEAGADFIVSPSLHKEVIQAAHQGGVMCMPGACTSTEAVNAHAWGADFVKLFPAGVLGKEYAQALMKPLNFIRYFAVCKMSEEMFEQFLSIGFAGAGISSCINDPSLIAQKRFDLIEERVRRYSAIAARYTKA